MQDISLITIEQSAKAYAKDREALAAIVGTLNEQLEAIKRAALPGIKRAVAKAAESKSLLSTDVDRARHLFIKPRTVIFHGIKCGLRKGAGGIDWDDDAKVCALIERLFPKAQAELLIKTKKTPIKKALEDLDVATLKKLGCTVEETGDLVVISAVDSDVDKIVNALLKGAADEAEQEAV